MLPARKYIVSSLDRRLAWRTCSAGLQLTCNVCRGSDTQCLSNTDGRRSGRHLRLCPVMYVRSTCKGFFGGVSDLLGKLGASEADSYLIGKVRYQAGRR